MSEPTDSVWVTDGNGWTFHHRDAEWFEVKDTGTLTIIGSRGLLVGYYARGAWAYVGRQAPPPRWEPDARR